MLSASHHHLCREHHKKKPIKTCELDPLPGFLFTRCLNKLLPFITDIINTSLSTGVVPDCFKSAIVRPLLKKPGLSVNDFENYRPVSNLPFLSKLLERVILDSFADDTQLYNSAKPEDFDELLESISICFAVIKHWIANKLKPNSGKTEALVIGTRQKVTSITSTDLQLADAAVHFSQTVKSLGVNLDSTLSMQPRISFIVKACFFFTCAA